MQNRNDKFFILIIFLIFLATIYLLSPILTPFLISIILAYLANPLVNRLTNLGLPRVISSIVVFILIIASFFLLIFLLVPLIGRQIDAFINVIPTITAWIQNSLIPSLQGMGFDTKNVNANSFVTLIKQNWSKTGTAIDWFFKTALYSTVRLMETLLNVILIPVVTFYLLCDWHKLIASIFDLIPRRMIKTVRKLAKECDEVLSAFLRGQLIVMLALSILYSLGLSLIGLKTGLLIGIFAGILSIVPYLGFVIGIIIASISAFVQFGSFIPVLFVFLVFIVVHIIENLFLTPKLIGDRIGLHPVIVIFAILAGGRLFGFTGVLLALPAAALIMVLLRHFHYRYRQSDLYRS